MKRLYDYTIVLRPEDNGTYAAYVPAIPGCHSWGQTPEEAQSELINVFEMIVEEYREEGRKEARISYGETERKPRQMETSRWSNDNDSYPRQ